MSEHEDVLAAVRKDLNDALAKRFIGGASTVPSTLLGSEVPLGDGRRGTIVEVRVNPDDPYDVTCRVEASIDRVEVSFNVENQVSVGQDPPVVKINAAHYPDIRSVDWDEYKHV